MRALVVDDEPAARRRLTRMLSNEAGVTVAGQCADATSAIQAIRDLSPDAVFLDIKLPELNGIDAAARISESKRPAIVFVTAYSEYAARAFEVDAIDYLLKPFSQDRVRTALDRINRRTASVETKDGPADCRAQQEPAETPKALTRIVVRQRGRIVLIPCDQVDWIEAHDKLVKLHVGAAVYKMREQLSHLEQQLDSRHFVRIHRSTIINLDRVRELQPAFHGDLCVVMFDGTSLILSRTYRSRVSEALGQKL